MLVMFGVGAEMVLICALGAWKGIVFRYIHAWCWPSSFVVSGVVSVSFLWFPHTVFAPLGSCLCFLVFSVLVFSSSL